MGVSILKGEDCGVTHEIFFCNTSMWAFGPVMDEDEGEPFFAWYMHYFGDPRKDPDNVVEQRYYDFGIMMGKEDNGELKNLEKFGWDETKCKFDNLPDIPIPIRYNPDANKGIIEIEE